jgi:hypothetical protein
VSASVNKVIDLYTEGNSIPQIAALMGMAKSTIRKRLIDNGVILRTRSEGVRLAGPRMSEMRRGTSRAFTSEWCANISAARLRWADEHAAGLSKKPSGYIEITRGVEKGRGEHVVIMERRLGRRLLPDEVVHHIDENRSNNSPDNLALMTRVGHSRHHQLSRGEKPCRDR